MMGPCMEQIVEGSLCERVMQLSIARTRREVLNLEQQIDRGDITIVLREKLPQYIMDIEFCTGRKMTQKQKELITDYVNNNRILRLNPSSDKNGRKEFSRKRAILREEWEKATGQKWPRYEKDICDSRGRIIRQKGQQYDAHHIIELSYGGPNVWYNLFPAKHPNEHQQGIHRPYSIASQIFIEENTRHKISNKVDFEVLQQEKKVTDRKEKKKKKKKRLVLRK